MILTPEEFREAVTDIAVKIWHLDITVTNGVDQICALMEARVQQERERTFYGVNVFYVNNRDYLKDIGGWAECQDVGVFVYFTKEQWQALQEVKGES